MKYRLSAIILEYFKSSDMLSVYLVSWHQIAYVSGLEIGNV